ncbi:MAG: hypothetical protein II942_02020 [Alphaproteobacteria bacterium]|nr:hypothetical protein [Alphaproteobacteria bacterium]
MKDYTPYLQKAFRVATYDILADVAKNGLTDGAYYMITFETPAATIPDFLRAQYPKEMTIILQNQFDNLVVEKDKFSVDLSFGGVATTVVVPFHTLKAFVDPDAQFGFNFMPTKSPEKEPKHHAEVIDLASRRKKK